MNELKGKLTMSNKDFPPIKLPSPIWKWDFLGDGMSLVITLTHEVSWFRRLFTKLLLGSKWTRIDNNQELC